MDFHIETTGQGRAILFIHAGVADSRMWSAQVDEFAGTHKVIVFDKRGFGRTPWVSEPYSDIEDSFAVLNKAGVDSAVIVGCSMGAGTAMNMAIEHPERVEGLVLVGGYPSGWVPPGGFEDNALEQEAEAAQAAGDFDRVVEVDMKMWLVGYGRSADDVDPPLKALFREMDRIPVRTESERNDHQSGFQRRLNEHLDEIEAPTLVVVGAHDEPVLLDAARYLADRLSDRPVVVIEDTAHLPSMEQPEAFNTVLRGFLASL